MVITFDLVLFILVYLLFYICSLSLIILYTLWRVLSIDIIAKYAR